MPARGRSSTSFSRLEASPRVSALEVGRVRGQSGELGQVAAGGVVDSERLVGIADPDVDVQTARQPAPGRPDVVGGDPAVAGPVGDGDRA